MDYEGKEGFVEGYIESVLPEILGGSDMSELSKMVISFIRDAFLVGFETGDGLGYQRGRQEGFDTESELAKQFSGQLFKKEVM